MNVEWKRNEEVKRWRKGWCWCDGKMSERVLECVSQEWRLAIQDANDDTLWLLTFQLIQLSWKSREESLQQGNLSYRLLFGIRDWREGRSWEERGWGESRSFEGASESSLPLTDVFEDEDPHETCPENQLFVWIVTREIPSFTLEILPRVRRVKQEGEGKSEWQRNWALGSHITNCSGCWWSTHTLKTSTHTNFTFTEFLSLSPSDFIHSSSLSLTRSDEGRPVKKQTLRIQTDKLQHRFFRWFNLWGRQVEKSGRENERRGG